jgi:alkanesulfonate monooxygenase SsuD/methylene tetrahydromethanopterin reductase-like flavin-dependent oxidoreductase (luciferase family)
MKQRVPIVVPGASALQQNGPRRDIPALVERDEDSLLLGARLVASRRPGQWVSAGVLQLPHAEPQNYTEQVGDVLALIAGTYRSADGAEAHVVPGEGAALQIWVLGSSGGESTEVAGRRSLRFAANYHVSPATVLEAVDGYRAAFQPSAELGRPCVSVSADVVVAGTAARTPARRHRSRRADHHHHHPRPRRSRSLVPAARRRMGKR